MRPRDPKRPTAERPPRPASWCAPAALLAGVLVFLPSVWYGFVFDDHSLVDGNVFTKSFEAVWEQFRHGAIRVVRDMSYALDLAVGGADPSVFHVSNIVWHFLSLSALWLVFKKAVPDRRAAIIALAAFAVHPVHVDAVSYVSGRRDILAGLFSFLAFYFFLRFREKRRAAWWIPLLVSTALAFYSKESGIVVPFLIFVYEWTAESSCLFPGKPWKSVFFGFLRTLKAGWWYYGAFLVGGAWASQKVLSAVATGKVTWWGGSVVTNFLTSFKIILFDAWLLVFPFNLRVDYSYEGFPVAYSAKDAVGILCLAATAASVVLLVRLSGKKGAAYAFWALWFLLSLLPVLHVVPHHEILAEHYLYVPSVGFAAVVGMGASRLLDRRPLLGRWTLAAVLGGWTVGLLAHQPAYRDDLTLWADAVKKAPYCVRANYTMGGIWLNRAQMRLQGGDMDGYANALVKSEHYYSKILEIPPIFRKEGVTDLRGMVIERSTEEVQSNYLYRDLAYYVQAALDLGDIWEALGRDGQAESAYLKGLELGTHDDLFAYRLGVMEAERKNFAKAAGYFRLALKSAPGATDIRSILGVALAEQGEWEQALGEIRAASSSKPKDPEILFNLGIVLSQMGDAHRAEMAAVLRRSLDSGLSEGLREQAESMLKGASPQ